MEYRFAQKVGFQAERTPSFDPSPRNCSLPPDLINGTAMKTPLLLILLATLAIGQTAQPNLRSIEGVVIEFGTGTPVAGALRLVWSIPVRGRRREEEGRPRRPSSFLPMQRVNSSSRM
jgi:hypothetical protein